MNWTDNSLIKILTFFVDRFIILNKSNNSSILFKHLSLLPRCEVRNILAFMGVDSKKCSFIEYVSNYVNNEVSSEGRWKMKKTNLIKTPKERITLGECVRTETGEPALKVKKSNKDMYETISMSQLIELMVLMSNQN